MMRSFLAANLKCVQFYSPKKIKSHKQSFKSSKDCFIIVNSKQVINVEGKNIALFLQVLFYTF